MTLERFGDAEVLGTFEIGSEEWLSARKLGGSTIGQLAVHAIADANPSVDRPFSSRWELWASCRGERSESTLAMRRGNFMEPFILEESRSELGDVRPYKASLRHHAEHWATTNLDGVIYDGDEATTIVEAKALHPFGRSEWQASGVPLVYRAQVLWQMWVTGLRTGYVAALFANDLDIYQVEYDAEDVEWLVSLGREFWHDHVLTGTPPPIDGSKGCAEWILRKWEAADDAHIALDEEVAEWARKHRQATADRKDAELRAREAQSNLVLAMQGAKKGMYDGGRAQVQQTTRLDFEALAADHQELVDGCRVSKFDEDLFRQKHPEVHRRYKTTKNTPYVRHYGFK